MCAKQIQEIRNVRPANARNKNVRPANTRNIKIGKKLLNKQKCEDRGNLSGKRCYETNWQQQVGEEGWGADLGKNYNSKRKIGNYLPSTC